MVKAADLFDLPGKLEVIVHKAEGLANVQKLNAVFGKQDPYVTACLVNKREEDLLYEQEKPREQSLHTATKQVAASLLKYTKKLLVADEYWERTKTISHGGINPAWEDGDADGKGCDNIMRFKHPGRPHGSQTPVRLLLRVMDQEKVGLDREIGATVVDVEALLKQSQPVECELDEDKGKVWLSFMFEPWPISSQNGILQLKKLEACHLSRRVTSKLRNPSLVAEIFPWNLRSQTLPLKGKNTAESFVWEDTLSLHYAGLKGRTAAESNLGLGLRLRLYGTTYLSVGQTKCLAEAWINPLPMIEAAITASKQGQEPDASIQHLDLYDARFGISKCGELKFHAGFTPQYDTEAANMSLVLDDSANKRALLIGINYAGKESPLRGCHNDVYAIQELLQETYGCVSFMVLLDGPSAIQPTAKNIRKGLKWLLEESKPGDKLFLHYSGHGSQVPDLSGDEEDGKDETLVPIDFDWERPETHITDDELKKQFQKLRKGSQLTVLFDCCHSGTLADLKLVEIPKPERARSPEDLKDSEGNNDVRSRFLAPCKRALEKIAELKLSRGGKAKEHSEKANTSQENRVDQPSVAIRGSVQPGCSTSSIVVLSGCRDNQTAADACINSKYLGATTWSVVQVVAQTQQDLSLKDLVSDVRTTVEHRGWKQVPQLSIQGESDAENQLWLEGWRSSTALRSSKLQLQPKVNNQDENEQRVDTPAKASHRELELPLALDDNKRTHSPMNSSGEATHQTHKWDSQRVHRVLRSYSIAKNATCKQSTGRTRKDKVNREARGVLKLGEKRIIVKPTGRKQQR